MGITGAVAFLKRIINLLSVRMTLQVHHCRYDFEVYLRQRRTDVIGVRSETECVLLSGQIISLLAVPYPTPIEKI